MGNLTLTIQKVIIEEYDKVFDSMITKDISMVANHIDDQMLVIARDILLKFTDEFIPNSKYVRDAVDEKILVGGIHYSIVVSIPPDAPDTINISYIRLYAANRRHQNPQKKSISIEEVGKFDYLELLAPHYLRINLDKVMAMVKTIFETSYGWLYHKIKSIVKESYIVSDSLYARIKTALVNNKEAHRSMWFVVQHKEQCIILLDSSNVNHALNKLNSSLLHPSAGPYQLLDEFVNMRLKFDTAFAKEALVAGKCINGKIQSGKYAQELPLLALGQIEIFTDEVSVYPIYTEGKNHLYASFPTKYRHIIEPTIDEHYEFLIEEFKTLNSSFAKMIKKFKTHRLDVSQVAEFLGTYSASFIKTYLQS